AIGRLGRVRRAAGARGCGRRVLHRGRERPERPVRPRDGPGQPSESAASVRGGHPPRGPGLHGHGVLRRGGPRGRRERVRLHGRDSQHCAHGPVRGFAQGAGRLRQPGHRLPRRILVPLRGGERIPLVDRTARPDQHPRGPRPLHDRGPGNYEGYRGRAGRRRPTDAPATDRGPSRGVGRRPCLPPRRPPQPGAPRVAPPVGGLRRPRHPGGRNVYLRRPPLGQKSGAVPTRGEVRNDRRPRGLPRRCARVNVYESILERRKKGPLHMTLLDPDKQAPAEAAALSSEAAAAGTDAILIAYLVVEPGMRAGEVGDAELISRKNPTVAVQYALAAQLLGMKLVNLEAGSGAPEPVPDRLIRAVREAIEIPVVVGGGIRTPEAAKAATHAGADIVVTGTIVEVAREGGALRRIIETVKAG